MDANPHKFQSIVLGGKREISFSVSVQENLILPTDNIRVLGVTLDDHLKFDAHIPYPEPVYTGWSSVHWNATGMPLVDPVYTGIPLEKLSWNIPTLECHWRNLVESAPHWDATGETLTFAAYTGTPLEGLWQPTHTPTHIVKYAE